MKHATGRSYTAPLRPGIDEPVTVTPDMLAVLRSVQRGGFGTQPKYRSHYHRAWSAVCHAGFIGFIGTLRGGYHVLTGIGKLALAQVEQQIVVSPEECLMQVYS